MAMKLLLVGMEISLKALNPQIQQCITLKVKKCNENIEHHIDDIP